MSAKDVELPSQKRLRIYVDKIETRTKILTFFHTQSADALIDMISPATMRHVNQLFERESRAYEMILERLFLKERKITPRALLHSVSSVYGQYCYFLDLLDKILQAYASKTDFSTEKFYLDFDTINLEDEIEKNWLDAKWEPFDREMMSRWAHCTPEDRVNFSSQCFLFLSDSAMIKFLVAYHEWFYYTANNSLAT